MNMFSDFRVFRSTVKMLTNPGDQMSTSLADIAIFTLPAFEFVNKIRGEARRHPILVGKQMSSFVSVMNQ